MVVSIVRVHMELKLYPCKVQSLFPEMLPLTKAELCIREPKGVCN